MNPPIDGDGEQRHLVQDVTAECGNHRASRPQDSDGQQDRSADQGERDGRGMNPGVGSGLTIGRHDVDVIDVVAFLGLQRFVAFHRNSRIAHRPPDESRAHDDAGHHADRRKSQTHVDEFADPLIVEHLPHPGDGAVATGERHLQQRTRFRGNVEERAEYQQHGEATEGELAEGQEGTEQRVGRGGTPELCRLGQGLADHDGAEDDVDHQARDHAPDLDDGLGEQSVGSGDFAEHLWAEEKHQESGDHACRDEQRPQKRNMSPDHPRDEQHHAQDHHGQADVLRVGESLRYAGNGIDGYACAAGTPWVSGAPPMGVRTLIRSPAISATPARIAAAT